MKPFALAIALSLSLAAPAAFADHHAASDSASDSAAAEDDCMWIAPGQSPAAGLAAPGAKRAAAPLDPRKVEAMKAFAAAQAESGRSCTFAEGCPSER